MSASIKKLLRYVLCFLLFCVSLCSCGTIMLTPHEHEWQSATCTEPKICAKCGETEGEPLGHDWEEATCVSPKTCQRCGATDGVPAKHTWKLATCTEPEICIICGEVNRQSSPLGHDWIPPTLSAPTVCKRCGVQDGEPLALASFNRGSAGRWGPRPSADQYVGVSLISFDAGFPSSIRTYSFTTPGVLARLAFSQAPFSRPQCTFPSRRNR